MRTIQDAKAMARRLRTSLAARKVDISHGAALELVAAQLGEADWNSLAARLPDEGASGDIRFESASPIMRIFDEPKAKEFYVDFLGFSLDWEHRFGDNFPLYAQVSRAGLVIHLSEHHGDASPGSTVFVTTRGIDAYRAELEARDYAYLKPGIEDQPWGRMMGVTDPFSNRIRFCEASG